MQENENITASPEFKQALEDTFGKAFFEQDITDRISDLEDCFAFLLKMAV